MIERPKKVARSEKQIFTNEQYQQYAEEQFNNIYDYLDGKESSGSSGIFPVGAIYLSLDSTNPSSYFGGEWELIKDTFLLGAGDIYTAGDTGGEAEHTLTVDELPSHRHKAGTTNITYSGEYLGLPSARKDSNIQYNILYR
jgi:hypothetical protein